MNSRETELKFIFLFFDLIILNTAIFVASFLQFYIGRNSPQPFYLYILFGNLSWVITYFIFSKKNLYLRDGYLNRIRRITKRTLVFLLVIIVVSFLLMPRQYSRSFLFEYTALFYIGKLIFYWLLYYYLKYKRKKGLNTIRVLITGENDTSQFLKQIIKSNPLLGYKVVGITPLNLSGHIGLSEITEQLSELIEKCQAQMLFVPLSLITDKNKEKNLLLFCNKNGLRIRFIPEKQRWYKTHINAESIGDIVLINPQEIPLDHAGHRILKRMFDIVFSSLVIIFLFSWLFPLLALLIKLNSKGPVFFIQERTGINNNTFRCLKFRSMCVNKQADIQQATDHDQRITRIGKYLRKYNIDELPQFFNVLWGQMSVVGPRPHMLSHTKKYAALIDHYKIRHYIKPGITGWAQINGYRGETRELWKMEKRIEYDMEYIENWNFGWDILIIINTVLGTKSYKNAC